MKKLFQKLLLIFTVSNLGVLTLHASQIPSSKQTTPSEVKIRVRITESTPKVVVRGYDLQVSSLQSDKTSEWEFRCKGDRILAVPKFSQKNSSKTLPTELKSPVLIQTPVGVLSYAAQLYREDLTIYAHGDSCEVVNQVDIEKYLEGIVNAEFSSKWNSEAIAAQVIAARTYAYYQMREAKKKGAHYDVDSSTRDQVYDGFRREDFQASRIVEKTRGLVLTTPIHSSSEPRLLPIKAFYHSTCGGQTELPEKVWGSSKQGYPGFKKRVSCPFCAVSPSFRWELVLKDSEVAQAIRQGFNQLLSNQHLEDIRILSQDSGSPVLRAAKVVTVWNGPLGRQELPISSAKFRDWIGPTRFKSTAFEVKAFPGKEKVWQFRGRGNGHGVGMCQWGAKTMGEKGFRTASILKHYYPDAILKKMW